MSANFRGFFTWVYGFFNQGVNFLSVFAKVNFFISLTLHEIKAKASPGQRKSRSFSSFTDIKRFRTQFQTSGRYGTWEGSEFTHVFVRNLVNYLYCTVLCQNCRVRIWLTRPATQCQTLLNPTDSDPPDLDLRVQRWNSLTAFLVEVSGHKLESTHSTKCYPIHD